MKNRCFLVATLLLAAACSDDDSGKGSDQAGALSDVAGDAEKIEDSNGSGDAGTVADTGAAADAGPVSDAGAVSDAAADAGAPFDAVAVADAGDGSDAVAVADAGAATDSGALSDAVAGSDSGAVSDAAASADAVPNADVGTAPTSIIVQAPGATLEIPVGALPAGTKVTLTKIAPPKADKDFAYTTAAFSIEPDGIELAHTATLTLTYDPAKLPKGANDGDQVVFFLANSGVRMAGLPNAATEDIDVHDIPEYTVDKANKTVSVQLYHFSNYVGGAASGQLQYTTQTHTHNALRVVQKTTGWATATARNQPTTHIVLHHTDGAALEPLAKHFKKGWTAARAGKASAQYWVGRNGVIAATTAPEARVGHSRPTNNVAPGIEIVNDDHEDYPLVQRLAVRRVVNFLADRFSIPLRGRWLNEWYAGPRSTPPGFSYAQVPPVSPQVKHYDRVLGHREVDGHTLLVVSRIPNYPTLKAGAKPATHLRMTASVRGKFRNARDWNCNTGSWSGWVNANAAWRRKIPTLAAGRSTNVVITCFKPELQTSRNVTINFTSRSQRKVGTVYQDKGGAGTGSFYLDNAPTHSNERGTAGSAANGWQPSVTVGRRRRDPGGDVLFPFGDLMTGLGFDHTGIIEASGGDSWLHEPGGKGGKVEFLAGHSFASGHFDTAENLYLNNQTPGGDESKQGYIKHVGAGTTATLGGAKDYVWLVVEGTLEITEDSTIKASSGIYVGPTGKIVARSKDKAKPDGFKLTLETLGEALILGLIDTRGLNGDVTGSSAAKGGKGGDVIIRQLANAYTIVPTIISRGGHTDATDKNTVVHPGGSGGAVTVKASGTDSRLIFTGGEGLVGSAPRLPPNTLAPSPPMNISTKWTHYGKFQSPTAPKVIYSAFKRGICTSGGMGPSWAGTDWSIVQAPGGPGGKGGKITVEAGTLVANRVAFWTGGGLEHFLVRVPVKATTALPAFISYTGGHGGSGRIGHDTKPGGEGGKGGDGGDVAISGTWMLTHTKGTTPVVGWNKQRAHEIWSTSHKGSVNGSCDTYKATVPGYANAELLRICHIGGSGGHPGGSTKLSSGDFGSKGKDGIVTGAP